MVKKWFIKLCCSFLVVVVSPHLSAFGLQAAPLYPRQPPMVMTRGIGQGSWLQSDLNGDGISDHLTVHPGHCLVTVQLSGTTVAHSFQIDSATTQVAVIDVDRDGDIDIVGVSVSGIRVWVNDSRGMFREPSRSDLALLTFDTPFSITEFEINSSVFHDCDQRFELLDLNLLGREASRRLFVVILTGAASGRAPPAFNHTA